MGNSIIEIRRLQGGDINEVFQIKTEKKNFCIKINNAKLYPEMLNKEYSGLAALRRHSSFIVPNVLQCGISESHQYLLMEYIEAGNPSSGFWELFGNKLAELHRTTSNKFGFDEDNYIGSLRQKNTWESKWHTFFAEHRILFQIKKLRDANKINQREVEAANSLCSKLESLMPKEPPALIHGDLWSGNYMVDANGNPCLIDPAIYYGHREMDIAMMHLFGGFRSSLFDSYNASYPLENGWEERINLCNIYPILVHANLFGGHYVNQAMTLILKYS